MMEVSPRTGRPDRVLCLVILAVYGVSFLLPAVKPDETAIPGYLCFWWSFRGLFLIFWSANLWLWLGAGGLVFGNQHLARGSGLLALAAALSVFVFIPPRDLLVGYYVWLASMVLLAA